MMHIAVHSLRDAGHVRLFGLLIEAGHRLILDDDGLALTMRAQGLRMAALSDVVPTERQRELRHVAGRLAGRARAVLNGAPGVEDELLRCVTAVEWLRAAHARWPLDAVVVGHDMTAAGQAVVRTARTLGVRSWHLPHAVFSRAPMEAVRRVPLRADVACVAGQRARDFYVLQGVDDARLYVTGDPRWDGYATATLPSQAESRRALGLSEDRPVLTLGTTWLERTHTRLLGCVRPLAAACREVFRAAAQLDAQVVIRFHPGERALAAGRLWSGVAGYRRMLHECGVTAAMFAGAGHDLVSLCAADAVVSFSSNLGVEALMCGVAAIDMVRSPDLRHALYAPEDAVATVDDADGIVTVVRQVLECGTDEDARVATIRRFNHRHDGRAAERVVRAVTAGNRACAAG